MLQTGYKKVPCLLIFVILESKILISVTRDPLLFQFVNCVRDPPVQCMTTLFTQMWHLNTRPFTDN